MITFLTSTELQTALDRELADDDMDELRALRDDVKRRFRQLQEVLSAMETLYGEPWQARDLRIWFADAPTDTVSSPIIVTDDEPDEALFNTFHMLAKNLIRQNYPDSELVGKGWDKLDAVAALLAEKSLEDVMTPGDFDDLMDNVKDVDETKLWRKADEYADQWDIEAQSLYDWLEEHG